MPKKPFEVKTPAEEGEKILEKSFDKLARLSEAKRAPKEKEVIILKGDREKIIREFAEDNDLSEKFVKRNYNILIIYSEKEGLGRAMFKKRELSKAKALEKATRISKNPFYCVASTEGEAIKKAAEKLAYDSELTVGDVKKYFKFRVTLGGRADLSMVKYFRKRP
ncbi:hypothetical protein KKA33_01275 [Patescibacteria group bacterium]|nr:hypothetical protein [Patescibacteria group bacterium]